MTNLNLYLQIQRVKYQIQSIKQSKLVDFYDYLSNFMIMLGNLRNNKYNIPIIFLLSSVTALVIAYVLQYFFNMLPCKLCIYERVVFYAAVLLAVACLLKHNKILIYMMFCSYIIGIIISFYHIGLELHWFHDIVGCTEQISNNVTMEELKNNLLNPNYSPSCDKPHYILGISLATWNLIYLLAVLSSTYIKKNSHC